MIISTNKNNFVVLFSFSSFFVFNSFSRNEPFEFQLGVSHVIKGCDEGLLDICVGEKRRLTIPPHLGYGDIGAGKSIPPKSTLIFEVECIDINQGPPPVNVFKEIDVNNDELLSRDEVNFLSYIYYLVLFNLIKIFT